MKKQNKLLAVFVAVVLVVCCCCIPVSAAEVEQSPLEFLGEFSKNNSSLLWNVAINGVGATGSPFKPIGLVKGGEGTQNEYWYANYKLPVSGGSYDSLAFSDMPFTQKVYLNKGDRFYLSFRVKYQFGSVRPSDFLIGLTSGGYDYHGPNGSSFYRDGITVPITDDGYAYQGNVTIDFIVEEESFIDGIRLRWSRDGWSGNEITWGFGIISPIILLSGNPDDIALQQKIDDLTEEQEKTNEMLGGITADKYTPPDGSTVGDVGDLEESILGDSEAGLNSAVDGFKSFSLDYFTDGLGGVVSLYNRIIPEMPWLNDLLTASLSIGIFAFLFGIAANHSRLFDREPVIHDKEYYEYRGDSESRWLL